MEEEETEMQLHKQTCRTIQTQKEWRKMKKPSSSSCGKGDVPRSRSWSYLEISHLANCPSHHANWSRPSSCNNTITDYLSIYLAKGPTSPQLLLYNIYIHSVILGTAKDVLWSSPEMVYQVSFWQQSYGRISKLAHYPVPGVQWTDWLSYHGGFHCVWATFW